MNAASRAGGRPWVVFFVGPSLPASEIGDLLRDVDAEITVLPPVEQGDILKLANRLPDVLGIIDGGFFQVPAVLHREILYALEHGVRVLGAASLGALRAAELDSFGMEGIGQVYRLYRSGVIDGDDEVAVLHAPAEVGGQPLTEPLVSVRHTLTLAQRQGIVAARTVRSVITALKRLHFTQRTYAAVLAATPEDERTALSQFLADSAVDLKRQDARLLVQTVAARLTGRDSWPARVPVRVNQTSHFWRYRREYVGQTIRGHHVADRLALSFQRIVDPGFVRVMRAVARRCVALDRAGQLRLKPGDQHAMLAQFRAANRLLSNDSFAPWLHERALPEADLHLLLHERHTEQQVLEHYRTQHTAGKSVATLHALIAADVAAWYGLPRRQLTSQPLAYPGVPWTEPLIRELKCRGTFKLAAEQAARLLQHAAELTRRHPELAGAEVRRGLLLEHMAWRWGITLSQMSAEIGRRGFASEDELAEAARLVFLHDRTAAGYQPERLLRWFQILPDAEAAPPAGQSRFLPV